jgi:predicted secreted Zn-dependent protease
LKKEISIFKRSCSRKIDRNLKGRKKVMFFINKLLNYCVFFSFLAFSQSSLAELKVNSNVSSYWIDGQSALILSAQMRSLGPLGVDGEKHPAITKWKIQWRLKHAESPDSCSIDKSLVILGLTHTRPRWKGENSGSELLKKRWAKFENALEKIESFHYENAVSAAKKIEAALAQVGTFSTCSQLVESTNQRANEILKKYKDIQLDYDINKKYGELDGLTLLQ